MARSRIALLTHLHKVITGKAELKDHESGWAKEGYLYGDHTMCLNGALALTEADLFNTRTKLDREYLACRNLLSREGEAIKGLLADTVQEMFPERIDTPHDGNLNVWRHYVIVDFNDHPDTTIADVSAVLEKCEAKAFERWKPPVTVPADDAPFIDSIT